MCENKRILTDPGHPNTEDNKIQKRKHQTRALCMQNFKIMYLVKLNVQGKRCLASHPPYNKMTAAKWLYYPEQEGGKLVKGGWM